MPPKKLDEIDVSATSGMLSARADVDLAADGSYKPLPPLPDDQVMERRHKAAQAQMMAVLTENATAMMRRHVQIGLGELRDDDGKAPDFMVQHMALSALEKHVLGAPKQTIEQNNRSISFKANFDIPAHAIDPRDQPERIDKPDRPKLPQPKQIEIPKILSSGPTAAEEIARWKAMSLEAAVAMPIDGYGTELPKEEK